jgi:hypothetical protein
MSTNALVVVVAIGVLLAWSATRGVIGVIRRHSMLRQLMHQRAGCTETTFVAELQRDVVEARVARTLYREIQAITRLHDGIDRFPVRAEDDLRELYLFTLWDYAGYPDDPDLWGLAHDVASASERRFSYDHQAVEIELRAVRTARDLAGWIQALPRIGENRAINSPSSSSS